MSVINKLGYFDLAELFSLVYCLRERPEAILMGSVLTASTKQDFLRLNRDKRSDLSDPRVSYEEKRFKF
jgi:hypothetical protein